MSQSTGKKYYSFGKGVLDCGCFVAPSTISLPLQPTNPWQEAQIVFHMVYGEPRWEAIVEDYRPSRLWIAAPTEENSLSNTELRRGLFAGWHQWGLVPRLPLSIGFLDREGCGQREEAGGRRSGSPHSSEEAPLEGVKDWGLRSSCLTGHHLHPAGVGVLWGSAPRPGLARPPCPQRPDSAPTAHGASTISAAPQPALTRALPRPVLSRPPGRAVASFSVKTAFFERFSGIILSRFVLTGRCEVGGCCSPPGLMEAAPLPVGSAPAPPAVNKGLTPPPPPREARSL